MSWDEYNLWLFFANTFETEQEVLDRYRELIGRDPTDVHSSHYRDDVGGDRGVKWYAGMVNGWEFIRASDRQGMIHK
jgi:hypothetical protein